MKKLLYKELYLTASPLSYFFLAFSLMVFIPQYPILIGAFFVCFGIFQSFQKAREANDIFYTAVLPIKKTDVVKTKFIFTLTIQAIAFVLMLVFCLLRMFVLNGKAPFSENKFLNANLVFLGFVLIIYAMFNIVFVGGFFKTGYKIGIPYLIFIVLTMITVGISEAIHFIPSLEILNANYHASHWIVFAIGVIAFLGLTALSYFKSKKNFEKIDL